MDPKSKDRFPANVIQSVAKRAGYFCSIPRCRQPTVGPHSDATSFVICGEAGHIKAASPEGPRYDPTQTSEERRGIENAIWVCATCSDIIDKDEVHYTVEKLHEIKHQHEEWVRNRGFLPSIPKITAGTLSGFLVPERPGHIDLSVVKEHREHYLRIQNESSIELSNLQAVVQLPEPIVATEVKYQPVGISVRWIPSRPDLIASGTGGVTRLLPPAPTHLYKLEIDRLAPTQHVEIRFLTSLEAWQGFSPNSELWTSGRDANTVATFIDGSFQFPYFGSIQAKTFFARLGYDAEKRILNVEEVREDHGQWSLLKMTFAT